MVWLLLCCSTGWLAAAVCCYLAFTQAQQRGTVAIAYRAARLEMAYWQGLVKDFQQELDRQREESQAVEMVERLLHNHRG